MNNAEVLDLLVYMVSSADGLHGEPEIYGPLRLIEASERLALMLAEQDPDHAEGLKELAQIIAERKYDCMFDADSFYNMLHDATAKLVDLY